MYERNVLCDACTENKNKNKRNERRLIKNPTRNRPFNTLSVGDQKTAFDNARHNHKMMNQKYSRLVNRLETNKKDLILEYNSEPKAQLRRVLQHLKEH